MVCYDLVEVSYGPVTIQFGIVGIGGKAEIEQSQTIYGFLINLGIREVPNNLLQGCLSFAEIRFTIKRISRWQITKSGGIAECNLVVAYLHPLQFAGDESDVVKCQITVRQFGIVFQSLAIAD